MMMNRSIASALSKTYYKYAFALLSKQVQYSVRDYEHDTNPWMFVVIVQVQAIIQIQITIMIIIIGCSC